MKTNLILAGALSCLLFNIANATQEPATCPTVSALQTKPLTLAEIDFPTNTYVAAAFNNNYDTTVKWSFLVGSIHAKDATDALQKATAVIPTLKLSTPTPQKFGSFDAWICGYQNDLNYGTFAISSGNGLALQVFKMLNKV